MNSQLVDKINLFVANVEKYLDMEYPAFVDSYKNNDCWDFIGSYYMGGSNVPDTARYVIELISAKSKEKNV